MKRAVVFFKTHNGKEPVIDFLDSLPSKSAQKIVWVLKLIEDIDQVPSQYFKKLVTTDGLWECRVQHGSNIYRVLGFMDQQYFIAVYGFAKKTQKLSKLDIEKAHNYKKEYEDKRRK